MNRVSRLLIKLEKYDEAVESINQEIELYAEVKEAPKVGKLTGGLVIVQLKRGDYVAAMKSYQNSFRFETEIELNFLSIILFVSLVLKKGKVFLNLTSLLFTPFSDASL